MNAHDMTNSGAFELSGLLLAYDHRLDAFSSLYDVWTYTWNYRNEMTGFSEKNASGTVIASGTYTYDSLDRRIGVDETSGGVTTQTWIVYNGKSNTPYAQFNGSGTLLERYLAGPSYVPGVTGMVARTSAAGVTDWYLTGKLGSVRDIVNTSGTVIDHISYGAFGSIRAETNPSSGSQFKFDGMQYDTITGLNNDWHRNFDSTSGRFVSQDPTGFQANDTNLLRFVNNSSTSMIDTNGNDSTTEDGNSNVGREQSQANNNLKVMIEIGTMEGEVIKSNFDHLLHQFLAESAIIVQYGNEIAALAKQMIIHMVQSIEKHLPHKQYGNGTINIHIGIIINVPGSSGPRNPEYAAGNQGDYAGVGWIGAPQIPNL